MVDGSQSAGPGFPARVARRSSQVLFRPDVFITVVWLIPAILGAALGTVGWLVSGWPWWPPVGAAVLWVTAFLLPLYWPGFRATRWSLLTELLLVVWPRRGTSRLRAEEERRFRRAPVPLHGLPAGFSGERQLAATGTGGSWHGFVVRWFSLGHGDPHRRPGATWLIVETASAHPAPIAAAWRKRMAERLWNLRLATCRDLDELRRTRTEIASQPDPVWSRTAFEVDGTPVVFESLADGECWTAWAVHDDVVLSLLASRMPIDSAALVRITDIEPYIDGSRRARTSMTCAVPPLDRA